jgi:hypothetical protein
MTAAAPRQRRRSNGRSSARLTDPYALVRDRLRGLVERLDEATKLIQRAQVMEMIFGRDAKPPAFCCLHDSLDDIASAIRDAADVLADLRHYGRLP